MLLAVIKVKQGESIDSLQDSFKNLERLFYIKIVHDLIQILKRLEKDTSRATNSSFKMHSRSVWQVEAAPGFAFRGG